MAGKLSATELEEGGDGSGAEVTDDVVATVVVTDVCVVKDFNRDELADDVELLISDVTAVPFVEDVDDDLDFLGEF